MTGKKKKRSGRRNQDERDMILTENSPWPVQEAYKALRTNVIFSLPGSECKVIGVSSAFMHDGKSINALNHAISYGQLGKQTLIIDADMRLPTVAKKLGIKGVPGLSDVLVGQSDIVKAIRRVSRIGIDVLPAGNIPPDPTWLLQSKQMKILLDQLRKYYDYIIIDLPPVTTVADASILAHQIDGYLLVVRDQSTEYRAINDMLEQMKLAKAKIIGFIYNDVAQHGDRYYKNYGQYYKKQ